jgi:hypothetical protein
MRSSSTGRGGRPGRRPLVGKPAKDMVEPGRGLLAQRPHQPARLRRPHAGQLARRTLISAVPTDPAAAARASPFAGTSTSRLTAQPSRRHTHPPGPATPMVGGTALSGPSVGRRVIALVGAAGQAQDDGRPGSRVESGGGASLSTGPASPARPSAAAAAAEGPAAAARTGPGARCLGDASSGPTSATGDKVMARPQWTPLGTRRAPTRRPGPPARPHRPARSGPPAVWWRVSAGRGSGVRG